MLVYPPKTTVSKRLHKWVLGKCKNAIGCQGFGASTWINEVLKHGILEAGPDGRFYPEETITRAEYAMAVQRLLVVAPGIIVWKFVILVKAHPGLAMCLAAIPPIMPWPSVVSAA
ncbi:MAG: hypothetical protein Ct9H300mP29_6720 [Candidatus Neomarinimicrobiota bacterium]|nr:MAG: hypothetical protein Ct9H300mP29_6720 [Candidatus Neomarinimicrobiota bacterium]